MSRRDNIEKRIRKIEKSEEKARKILIKQRRELLKALDDNEKLIDQKLNKAWPQEVKIEAEIEKLTKRLDCLNKELGDIRMRREEVMAPLRQRSLDLKDKLKIVDVQIESTKIMPRANSDADVAGTSEILPEEFDPMNASLDMTRELEPLQNDSDDLLGACSTPSAPPRLSEAPPPSYSSAL